MYVLQWLFLYSGSFDRIMNEPDHTASSAWFTCDLNGVCNAIPLDYKRRDATRNPHVPPKPDGVNGRLSSHSSHRNTHVPVEGRKVLKWNA